MPSRLWNCTVHEQLFLEPETSSRIDLFWSKQITCGSAISIVRFHHRHDRATKTSRVRYASPGAKMWLNLAILRNANKGQARSSGRSKAGWPLRAAGSTDEGRDVSKEWQLIMLYLFSSSRLLSSWSLDATNSAERAATRDKCGKCWSSQCNIVPYHLITASDYFSTCSGYVSLGRRSTNIWLLKRCAVTVDYNWRAVKRKYLDSKNSMQIWAVKQAMQLWAP